MTVTRRSSFPLHNDSFRLETSQLLAKKSSTPKVRDVHSGQALVLSDSIGTTVIPWDLCAA